MADPSATDGEDLDRWLHLLATRSPADPAMAALRQAVSRHGAHADKQLLGDLADAQAEQQAWLRLQASLDAAQNAESSASTRDTRPVRPTRRWLLWGVVPALAGLAAAAFLLLPLLDGTAVDGELRPLVEDPPTVRGRLHELTLTSPKPLRLAGQVAAALRPAASSIVLYTPPGRVVLDVEIDGAALEATRVALTAVAPSAELHAGSNRISFIKP